MPPQNMNIVFKESNKTLNFPILGWEAHTYGFLELKNVDGTSTFFSLSTICSFEPSETPASPLPVA